jgi:hypothetical protein
MLKCDRLALVVGARNAVGRCPGPLLRWRPLASQRYALKRDRYRDRYRDDNRDNPRASKTRHQVSRRKSPFLPAASALHLCPRAALARDHGVINAVIQNVAHVSSTHQPGVLSGVPANWPHAKRLTLPRFKTRANHRYGYDRGSCRYATMDANKVTSANGCDAAFWPVRFPRRQAYVKQPRLKATLRTPTWSKRGYPVVIRVACHFCQACTQKPPDAPRTSCASTESIR